MNTHQAMHQVTDADLEALRPGCTQFLQCPSLRDGQRVEYKRPFIDMTRQLADRTSHDRRN